MSFELVNLPLLEQAALSTLLSQPHRHYHNVNHVNDMLVEMESYLKAVGDPLFSHDREVLTYAIWYHDAVYNPYAPLGWNERYSSNLFYQQHRFNQTMEREVFELIQQAISATAFHTLHQQNVSPIVQVLLDIDLSGFGHSLSVYSANGEAIRKEYYKTSTHDFLTNRLKFLKTLLQRPSLYYTPHFQNLYHIQSQENIQIDIESIERELT